MFLLIVVLTTTAAFTLVYNEISDVLDLYAGEVTAATAGDTTAEINIAGIKLRVFLLLTGGLLTTFLLSILWLRSAIHQINRPIHELQRAVSRLAHGELNETVDIGSHDEFGQIGAGINELAANLQELLLYIWKQTGQCTAIVKQLNEIVAEIQNEPNARKADELVRCLSESVENLKEMAKAYVFYDVRLEGEKALAINHPGKKEPPGAPIIEDESSF